MQTSASDTELLTLGAILVIGTLGLIAIPIYGAVKLTDAISKSRSKNPTTRVSNPRNY